MPNSSQLRSSVSTCLRDSSSRMRAAVGVPSVGTLWSAVASVGSGGRTRRPAGGRPAAGETKAVEGLRAGDLVHEVQVDVQQARRHLVGGPDLVEQRLWHLRISS